MKLSFNSVAETIDSLSSPIMLGDGWYEDRFGGLNRYFSDLFHAYQGLGGNPHALVVGPGNGAPSGFTVAGHQGLALPIRLWKYFREAEGLLPESELVDAHFALHAFLPVVTGLLRHHALIVHFHGPWAEESESARSEARWRVQIKKGVERCVYARAQRIVTLSAAFRRVLIERYDQDPWKIEVVPPGVNLQMFLPGNQCEARSSLGVPIDAKIVVAVRRLVPRMGLDILIRSWTQLQHSVPNAILLIVGDGPERTHLEGLAMAEGMTSSIRFLGRVDDSTLLASYRAADVAVVPTVALEGFGLIVLEALACGTPVVATDVGGLPEVLRPLNASLIVPSGNSAALAARLEAALNGSPPLPTSEQCRVYAEGFSWEKCASRHAAIHSQVGNPAPRKLRVVFLDHCAQLSGGEIALLRLLQSLDQIEAHVILAEDGPLVSRMMNLGISVEVLPMHETARSLSRERVRPGEIPSRSALHSAVYCLKLARRLHRFKPDIVHTNSLKAAVYGLAAARLAGIPGVWHLRDRIASDYLPLAAVKLIRVWARYMPSGVIANSEATLASVRPTAVSAVIASPISANPLPLKLGLSPRGALRVGMVGRICPWKGQDVFLKAFAAAFPDSGAQAVIIGAALFGEQEYDQQLRMLAEQLGVANRVKMKGFRDDVAEELSNLDILVHASTSPEPFGLVVVEGMSAGLPVVASDGGGPAEVITHGVNGLLYPAGDYRALAELLTDLAANPELRKQLSAAAIVRSRDFSPEVIAPSVMKLYRDTLGEHWPAEVAAP